MKKWKILLIELGMVACISAAAIVVPGSTPLMPFLAVSVEFLTIGNYFVAKAIEKNGAETRGSSKFHWSSLFLVFAIINFPWMLSQFRYGLK